MNMSKIAVMIVSVDFEFIRTLHHLLNERGNGHTVVYTFQQVIEVINCLRSEQEELPDLMVVDADLPGLKDPNQVEWTKVAVFARSVGVPCMVVASNPSFDMARSALRAVGADSPLAFDIIAKEQGPLALLSAARTLRPSG